MIRESFSDPTNFKTRYYKLYDWLTINLKKCTNGKIEKLEYQNIPLSLEALCIKPPFSTKNHLRKMTFCSEKNKYEKSAKNFKI